MCPTFQPPTIDENPPVLGDVPPFPQGTPEQRLWGHYRSRPRGRTVLLLSAGGCALLDYPSQLVPGDPSEGDPWIEVGLGGYLYTEIDRIFMGGHVYRITSEEAERLTECGYGGGVIPDPGFGEGGFGEGGFGGD